MTMMTPPAAPNPNVVVVVPCFKVRAHVALVLERIGPQVKHILCVDDACPEQSGLYIQETCKDPRVEVLFHEHNCGVGGAVSTGYVRALQLGATVVVKLDGDGQMDPALIDKLVRPILAGKADYCKGNRFCNWDALQKMPWVRLVGNAGLACLNKTCTGYWSVMDPTNGFTAIHGAVLRALPLNKLSKRYFFESDMLFRLSIIRAVVRDMPMAAVYAQEKSGLSIGRSLVEFPGLLLVRFFKRLLYRYFVMDFNVGSLELLAGLFLLTLGTGVGAWKWAVSASAGVFASAGQVMLATVPVLFGFQLLLAALVYDVLTEPKQPIHPELE